MIDERLDLDLRRRGSPQRAPDWQIVMVGPGREDRPGDACRSAPNLHWLGMQPYAVLPHLLAGWDVCLMPFAINEATRFISPTKTLEYLAAGKPVVSTAVPDVELLYGEQVAVARDAAAFIAACAAALAETPAERDARIARNAATLHHGAWISAPTWCGN